MLLEHHYPFRSNERKCLQELFTKKNRASKSHLENIYQFVLHKCQRKSWILVGATAFRVYQEYDVAMMRAYSVQRTTPSEKKAFVLPEDVTKSFQVQPSFSGTQNDIDVVTLHVKEDSQDLFQKLQTQFPLQKFYCTQHKAVGELMPEHAEIGCRIGRKQTPIVYLYQSHNCITYHDIQGLHIKIGTPYTLNVLLVHVLLFLSDEFQLGF